MPISQEARDTAMYFSGWMRSDPEALQYLGDRHPRDVLVEDLLRQGCGVEEAEDLAYVAFTLDRTQEMEEI